MPSQIIDLEELKKYDNFVMGYGHFSTIHPGHIRYLKHAKLLAKQFIVCVRGDGNPIDGKPKFEFSQKERVETLAMLDIVDGILLLKDDELVEIIKVTKPKLLVLGKQFENNPEEIVAKTIEILSKRNISVLYHGGDISYSSTELLTSSEDEIKLKRKQEFKAACKRQSLTKQILERSIDSWKDANLIVIGDTIVDRYVACEAVGMSAEAPVLVVKELQNRNFAGGAAIVASHIKSLGAKCKLISVVGNDKNGKFVKEKLLKEGIKDGIVIDDSRPTTFKKRYIVENQKLFRVSRLEQSEIDKDIEQKIIYELSKSARQANGIVISDFVYGVITKRILKTINELAIKYKLLLFGDLQCSSQVGSIMKFQNFSLLCPNEREARIALHEKDLDLESLSNKIIEKTKSKMLIMKLGSNGFIAYEKNEKVIRNQAFPALSINPLDVAGAGDSLLAVMAVGLSSTQKIMPTAAIACCMASLAVERMGNIPITKEEIHKYLIEKIFK